MLQASNSTVQELNAQVEELQALAESQALRLAELESELNDMHSPDSPLTHLARGGGAGSSSSTNS